MSFSQSRQDPTNRAVVTAFFAVFALLLIVVMAAPRKGFVLVVADPRASAANLLRVIADANGTFVASGRYPWTAVAYADDSDFSRRLLRAGAILVLNHNLAVGCSAKDIR
jgi:hypothetical protein